MNASGTVFVVQHVIDDQDSEPKLLGVYETRDAANEAVLRFSQRDGFCDHLDGFYIDEYKLNKDYWESGFTEH